MKRNKKGFTLIELLAVIAILAIVLLIAIPTVLNMIDRARTGAFRDSCLALIKSAEAEVALYSIEEDSTFSNVGSTEECNSTDFATGVTCTIKDEKLFGMDLTGWSGSVTIKYESGKYNVYLNNDLKNGVKQIKPEEPKTSVTKEDLGSSTYDTFIQNKTEDEA